MEKFSRKEVIDNKIKVDTPKDKIIYKGDYLQIIKYEDWEIMKEKDLVVCIPYLIEENKFIIRQEYIPTFKYVDGQEYHIVVISGSIETGESPETTLIRELEEEAGIVLREDFKIDVHLKPLFFNKATANKYYPYILPLNERDYHEIIPPTDGSRVEKLSKSAKIDIKYLSAVNASDLISEYMLLKFRDYLNL